MNKKQVIWLLIRLAGIWFVWQSLENAIGIVSSYWVASNEPRLLSASGGVFLSLTIRMVVYLVIGLYCLGGGELIFSLLTKERDIEEDQEGFPHHGTIL